MKTHPDIQAIIIDGHNNDDDNELQQQQQQQRYNPIFVLIEKSVRVHLKSNRMRSVVATKAA